MLVKVLPYVFFLLLGMSIVVFLQSNRSEVSPGCEKIDLRYSFSSFGEKLPQDVGAFASDPEAESMIDNIIAVSGVDKRAFSTRSGDVPNAVATICNEIPFIIYNRDFIGKLTKITGTEWAPVAVMAHEVAHHVNAHTIKSSGSQIQYEIAADESAGFWLQQMGATKEQAQAVFKMLGPVQASDTHPSRRDRLRAISQGWDRGCARETSCSITGPNGEIGVATYQDWSVFKRDLEEDTICFAASTPSVNSGASVDDVNTFFLVARWKSGVAINQPSFMAGYFLDATSDPIIRVGNEEWTMYVNNKEAFIERSSDEMSLIAAMLNAEEFQLSTISQLGNKMDYKFSLLGFSDALRRIELDC